MTTVGQPNYDQWVQILKQAGLKTTHLGNGEANFADYTFALSDEILGKVSDSFDCEQDYELQANIAAMYKNTNFLDYNDLVNAGYKVSVTYTKTTYIVDNKKDGRYDTDVTNGAIAVYTISDGKGGEIVIADANGNGGLETEELFMNQLINDVAVDVDKIKAAKANPVSGGSAGVDSTGNIFAAEETTAVEETKETEEAKEEEKTSQTDFNKEVESYLNKGYTLEMAVLQARENLNAHDLDYTGSAEEQIEEEPLEVGV